MACDLEKKRKRIARYRNSPAGKAARKRYKQSAKSKINRQKSRQRAIARSKTAHVVIDDSSVQKFLEQFSVAE